MLKKIASLLSVAVLTSQVVAMPANALNPENVLFLELKDGRVMIELLPEVAPNHVARIKELTRKKFYDDVVFHRVIDGFMAQTGDPTGTGMGGSDLPNLKAEFNPMPHVKGTVSMARAGTPDSANSQFFICLDEAKFLDKQYTVFGRVVSGMEFVDKIKKGDANNNGAVVDPDHIVSLKVASDVAEVQKPAQPAAAPAEAKPAAETPVAPIADPAAPAAATTKQ